MEYLSDDSELESLNRHVTGWRSGPLPMTYKCVGSSASSDAEGLESYVISADLFPPVRLEK